MEQFNIFTQVKKEIESFYSERINLVNAKGNKKNTIRYLTKEKSDYSYNQSETISLIDLYYSSKFESGSYDDLGLRKMFLNVGKFRTDVAAKQIDIDVKDFRFIPEDYSNSWTAFFMQKSFKEWTKDNYFGDQLNQMVENFPKYGTIVMKKSNANDRKIDFVPLQCLKNDQCADSLRTANYVIEEHHDMRRWEIDGMKGWNTEGLDLPIDKACTVYERYGHVPLTWLKAVNNEEVKDEDRGKSVDALVILTAEFSDTKDNKQSVKQHIFFASEIKERPYLEVHWNKVHGRWLGVGVMEDLIENQIAKNIIVNLMRRSLQWSSRKLFQSRDQSIAAKNLIKDVADGDILEVGQAGNITQLNTVNQASNDFNQFLNEWENNSNQKSFTYEVATGEALPSGTPFRLGVVLSNAVNSYFGLKREKLGLFLKKVITEFMIPEFIKDFGNESKIVSMYSDEPGFESLKVAAGDYLKTQFIKLSLMSGKPVDLFSLESVITPLDSIKSLFLNIPPNFYKEAKYKFTLDITGEEYNPSIVETLTTIYQILAQKGDPRADTILEKITAKVGVDMSSFNTARQKAPVAMPAQAGGQMPNVNINAGNQQAGQEI